MSAKIMDKCAVEVSGYANELPCVDEMMYTGDHATRKETNALMKYSCSENESSSSIGKNSDLSENSLEKTKDGEEEEEEEEVQSSYKNPFDTIGDLENVLPIRKGMSRFYNGKSKSFTSLAEASSLSSIKDLAKPENVFTKKRRNPLAYCITWDKTRSSPLRSNGVGISKRVSNLSGTSLALAVAMNNSENDKRRNSSTGSFAVSSSMKDFYHWKSFSLVDLQQCGSVATSCSNPNQCDIRLS